MFPLFNLNHTVAGSCLEASDWWILYYSWKQFKIGFNSPRTSRSFIYIVWIDHDGRIFIPRIISHYSAQNQPPQATYIHPKSIDMVQNINKVQYIHMQYPGALQAPQRQIYQLPPNSLPGVISAKHRNLEMGKRKIKTHKAFICIADDNEGEDLYIQWREYRERSDVSKELWRHISVPWCRIPADRRRYEEIAPCLRWTRHGVSCE